MDFDSFCILRFCFFVFLPFHSPACGKTTEKKSQISQYYLRHCLNLHKLLIETETEQCRICVFVKYIIRIQCNIHIFSLSLPFLTEYNGTCAKHIYTDTLANSFDLNHFWIGRVQPIFVILLSPYKVFWLIAVSTATLTIWRNEQLFKLRNRSHKFSQIERHYSQT